MTEVVEGLKEGDRVVTAELGSAVGARRLLPIRSAAAGGFRKDCEQKRIALTASKLL